MGCIIKRILTLKEPVIVNSIKIYDEFNRDVTENCQYSWSNDGVCWTNWTDFNTYSRVSKSLEGDYYLRILLFGGFEKLVINDSIITCYSICLFNENMFLQDLCTDTVFDPYANLDCALLLQQQLSDAVICMLGIPCYYFRVVPDKSTADYTFKEYILHNVETVKYIKLMISNGTMPSSKPQMTDFDFDWETDWEVEVSKNYFAKAFGDNAFPKHNDFVYIPMMKRMWNVNSAYDEKNAGLLWHSTTWKLGLVKYNENTNVDQGDFEDIIDSLLVNTYENTFEYPESEEQRTETAIDQITSPEFSANNLYKIFMTDYLRKSVDKSELKNVAVEQVNHGSTIIARNYYNFTKSSELEYQKSWCGDSGTLEFLLETTESGITKDKPLFRAGNIVIKIEEGLLKFGKLEFSLKPNNKYIIICKWNKHTFITSLEVYKLMIPTGVPSYLMRPELCKFDFENPICNITDCYNDDYDIKKPSAVLLNPYKVKMYGVKMYDTYLDSKNAIKESCKYTTTNEHCVINDIARPFEENYGFNVK